MAFFNKTLILLVAAVGTFCCFTTADPINFNLCDNDHTFEMEYLDVQGCNKVSACKLNAGQNYTVKFSGCYNGTVTNIAHIPYDIKSGLAPGLEIIPIDSGDLCDSFTSDSATTSCPATKPPSPAKICGTWLLNVRVPIEELGLIPIGLPSSVKARAWANNAVGTPVTCVQFQVVYHTL